MGVVARSELFRKQVPRETLEAIIDQVADGVSPMAAAKKLGVDRNRIHTTLCADPELEAALTHARGTYLVSRVHTLEEVARDMELCPQRAKLICDNIKWEVAKVLPRIYGDKLTHDVNVSLDISGAMEAATKRIEERIIEGETVVEPEEDHSLDFLE